MVGTADREWDNFLDKNCNLLLHNFKLSDAALILLRDDGIITEGERQLLAKPSEKQMIARATEFMEILRVSSDRFHPKLIQLIGIMTRQGDCPEIVKLFMDYAKTIGTTVPSKFVNRDQQDEESTGFKLFENPPELQLDQKPRLAENFQFDPLDIDNVLKREDDVQNLRRVFISKSNKVLKGACKIVVLSGIGGIGKSSLAKLFAESLAKPPLEIDNRIWIRASQDMNAQFARLAEKKFGIESSDQTGQALQPESFMPALYDKLCDARTLLVFDNADTIDEQELIKYLPKSIKHAVKWRPLVLITCRPRQWQLDPFKKNIIELDALKHDVAVKYIQDRLPKGCEDSHKTVDELVQFYGYSIIALNSVIAQIKERNEENQFQVKTTAYTVGELYEDAKSRGIQIKQHAAHQKPLIELGSEYDNLQGLWQNSFDRLEKSEKGQMALQVLYTCACLNPDGIPYKMMKDYFWPGEKLLPGAIKLLRDHSLVTWTKATDEKPFPYLRIHRILQKVCLKLIGTPEEIVKLINARFATLDDLPLGRTSVDDPENVDMYQCLRHSVLLLQMFPHNLDAAKALPDKYFFVVYRNDLLISSMGRITLLDVATFDLETSLNLYCCAAYMYNAVDQNSKALEICQQVQDYVEACKMSPDESEASPYVYERLEALLNLIMGKVHLNSDDIQQGQQKITQAFGLYQQCGDSLTRVDRWHQIECGVLLSDPWSTKRRKGRLYSDEIPTGWVLLTEEFSKYGHSLTWDKLSDAWEAVHQAYMADPWSRNRKDYQHTNVYNEMLEILSSCDPKDIVSCGAAPLFKWKLAETSMVQGDWETALKLQEEVVFLQGQSHGSASWGSRISKVTYADMLASVGRFSEAIQLIKEHLSQPWMFPDIDEKPTVLNAKRKLIKYLMLSGSIQEVVREIEATRELVNMSQIQSAHLGLIEGFVKQELDTGLLDIVNTRGPSHFIHDSGFVIVDDPKRAQNYKEGLAVIFYLLGMHHYSHKDFHAARQATMQGLEIYEDGFGKFSDATIAYRNLLAMIDRDEAIIEGRSMEQVLASFISLTYLIQEDKWPFDPFVQILYYNLGTVLYYTGRFSESLQVFKGVWELQSYFGDKNDSHTLRSKFWYGKSLLGVGKIVEAKDVIQQVSDSIEDQPEASPRFRAHLKYALATVLKKLGRAEEATRMIEEAAAQIEDLEGIPPDIWEYLRNPEESL